MSIPGPGAAPTQGAEGPASARLLQLGRMSGRALERVLLRGVTPYPAALVGWEFRGMNTPPWAGLLGIRKFIKGFARAGDGAVIGYNCPVRQNRRDQPWIARPDHARPRRFGYYRVTSVDPTARDRAYLHALLLDYGRGDNARLDPARGLRDYLVQVDAGDPDLYLGKAYYALGPRRLAVGFFVLERLRRAPEAATEISDRAAAHRDGPRP